MRSASNGYEYYNIAYDKLLEIANKEKWICKYDADIIENSEEVVCDDYEKLIEEKDREIKNLLDIIEKQKQQLDSKQTNTATVNNPDSESITVSESEIDLFSTL